MMMFVMLQSKIIFEIIVSFFLPEGCLIKFPKIKRIFSNKKHF